MQALELKVPPPLAALLIALAMWVAAHILPTVYLPDRFRFMIANACGAVGLIVAVLGFSALRRAKTTSSPVNPEAASSIVTSGIYRYTRNPMYVGLTAVLVGWAVWLSVPWVLLGPVALMLFLTRFQISPEERALSSKLNREYGEYRTRVRRWL